MRLARNLTPWFVLMWLCCCPAWADVPRGVNLADLRGWDIVVAEDAIPSELFAAEEFRQHVAAATGCTLPIVRDTDRADRHVFIGSGPTMQQSEVGFDIGGFGAEDLRIVIRNNNITIAGGRPRGTLYGVYTFLEDYLGVRFLTREHTHIPQVGQWHVVGPVDRFYHPALEMRWAYYGEVNRHADWAARLRVNTVDNESRESKLGGKSPHS